MTPMLAGKITAADLSQLDYPVIVQQKFDGVRCFLSNQGARTRTDKKIVNNYIGSQIEKYCHEGMDGEIIIPGLEFSDVNGVVRSESSFEERNFQFIIFDWAKYSDQPYTARYNYMRDLVAVARPDNIKIVKNSLCNNSEQVQFLFNYHIQKGDEGIIIRDPNGYYKYGRSTVREGALLKLKYESTGTARIISVHPLVDKEGIVKDKLGAIEVVSNLYGVFRIGSGFTEQQRKDYWESDMIGRNVHFTFQQEGMKNKPRFPVFQRMV